MARPHGHDLDCAADELFGTIACLYIVDARVYRGSDVGSHCAASDAFSWAGGGCAGRMVAEEDILSWTDAGVCHGVAQLQMAFVGGSIAACLGAWPSVCGSGGQFVFLAVDLDLAAGYFPGDHTALHKLTAQIESLPEDSPAEQIEPLLAEQQVLSASLIENSFLGRAGHAIEPLVRPLGWDWKIGVGVLASFPAREVIVSTLGTIYSLGGDVEAEDEGLRAALRNATWPDGRPVFTLPVALSIMVFFALCAQCAATLMIIRRETNSWWWPLFTFVYMTGLAYIAALVVFSSR